MSAPDQTTPEEERLLQIWLKARSLSEEALIAYHNQGSTYHQKGVERHVRDVLKAVRTVQL